jgi:hypothetical protein
MAIDGLRVPARVEERGSNVSRLYNADYIIGPMRIRRDTRAVHHAHAGKS